MRGEVTDAIKEKAKELLGIEKISTVELRLMSYVLHVMVNDQLIDPMKINAKERKILSEWRSLGGGQLVGPDNISIGFHLLVTTTTNDEARLTEVKANSALVMAAGTAATTAEDMGYDGQAVVEKLPELLEGLKILRDHWCHGYCCIDDNGDGEHTDACKGATDLLASCCAKESSDV